MESTNLTIQEAYAAMYKYLELLYQMTGSDDLGGILGGMSLLPDGGTADPAAWNDWLRVIAELRSGSVDTNLHLEPDSE